MYSSKDLTKPTYKLKEISQMTGLHSNTLRKWDNIKKYEFSHSSYGYRYMTKDQLILLLKGERMYNSEFDDILNNKRDVIYARVSSHEQKQKGDLDRQAMFLIQNISDLKNPFVLSEVGSGLNDKRKKLLQLIHLVMTDQVNRVFVTYKDRLTRFGFNMLETTFNEKGVDIIVVKDTESEKTVEQELVEDMTALVASFSGKLYGMRSGKNKQKKEIGERK